MSGFLHESRSPNRFQICDTSSRRVAKRSASTARERTTTRPAVGWISAAHPPSPTQHDTAPLGGRFDETILERLVALNAERAAEEKRGHVRWLRPDFQNPNGQATAQQMAMDDATPAALAKGEKKLTWPKTLPEQVRAVADLIAASPMPLDADAIGTQFKASKTARERLRTILDTLIALGRVRRDAQGRYVGG